MNYGIDPLDDAYLELAKAKKLIRLVKVEIMEKVVRSVDLNADEKLELLVSLIKFTK